MIKGINENGATGLAGTMKVQSPSQCLDLGSNSRRTKKIRGGHDNVIPSYFYCTGIEPWSASCNSRGIVCLHFMVHPEQETYSEMSENAAADSW